MSESLNLAQIRNDYKLATLSEIDVDASPFHQFDRWMRQAIDARLPEPTAMTLATADRDGRPSARIVLLKAFDAAGAVFYTNFASRKGRELAIRPDAALLFYWAELERQVRIEGTVTKVESEEADAYYSSRPFGSRIGAWASPQSEPIASRQALEERVAAFRQRYEDAPVRPPHWGGYRLAPVEFEFWQGRSDRLHDRIRYRRQGEEWTIERLAP